MVPLQGFLVATQSHHVYGSAVGCSVEAVSRVTRVRLKFHNKDKHKQASKGRDLVRDCVKVIRRGFDYACARACGLSTRAEGGATRYRGST